MVSGHPCQQGFVRSTWWVPPGGQVQLLRCCLRLSLPRRRLYSGDTLHKMYSTHSPTHTHTEGAGIPRSIRHPPKNPHRVPGTGGGPRSPSFAPRTCEGPQIEPDRRASAGGLQSFSGTFWILGVWGLWGLQQRTPSHGFEALGF